MGNPQKERALRGMQSTKNGWIVLKVRALRGMKSAKNEWVAEEGKALTAN